MSTLLHNVGMLWLLFHLTFRVKGTNLECGEGGGFKPTAEFVTKPDRLDVCAKWVSRHAGGWTGVCYVRKSIHPLQFLLFLPTCCSHKSAIVTLRINNVVDDKCNIYKCIRTGIIIVEKATSLLLCTGAAPENFDCRCYGGAWALIGGALRNMHASLILLCKCPRPVAMPHIVAFRNIIN